MHFHRQLLPQEWQQLQDKEVITTPGQVTPQVSHAHLPRHHLIPEDLQEDQDLPTDRASQEATDHLAETTSRPYWRYPFVITMKVEDAVPAL